MSRLEDEFIVACGKAGGEFVYEKDTNRAVCWLRDPDRHQEFPDFMHIRLDKNDVEVGDLIIKNIEGIGFDTLTMKFKSKHADIQASYDTIGGMIK